MKDKRFRKYYIFSVAGTLAASFYPLYMGVRVVSDMITKGTVMKEDYPKYIIPYTPISLALIAGILLMPLLMKCAKRAALLLASVISAAVFFGAELLLESKVIVTSTFESKLENWQMFMCMWPVYEEEPLTQTAIEILMGDYNPAFKLHFYAISVVLILSILNCFYGFAHMIQSGEKKRMRTLIIQSICSGFFLGLCILACFTAFFRNGEIQVSFISAILMTLFFILFGVTAGVCAGSLLLKKNRWISIGIPAVTASLMTTLMYIGEMILLKGHLYRFGRGFLCRGLFAERPVYYLKDGGFSVIGNAGPAPVDFIIILASGLICAAVLRYQKSKTDKGTLEKEDEL